MRRWTMVARESMLDREAMHASNIRRELAEVAEQLKPEEDWFYTRELRMRGLQLVEEGDML